MRRLVFATLFTFFGAFGLLVYQKSAEAKQEIPLLIDTTGYPTIGPIGAPNRFVLFEDFRCKSCRTFHDTVLPELRSRYIDTGIAQLTIIPLAIIRGSEPMANAAIEVYRQNPDLFFSYASRLFEAKEGSIPELVYLAHDLSIDQIALGQCLLNDCHHAELEKNIDWAHEIMGPVFSTPALYLNGIKVSALNLNAVASRMEEP
jgi:protein-disulfide isomerase